jgi:DinB family protein
MDGKILDAFETGAAKLRAAIAGLTPKDFLWVPAPGAGIGRWSIQQVVLHLMDDELIWASRMKTIIAEDNPQILGFDESRFAANLHPEAQDPEAAVQIVELNRGLFSTVLRNLHESSFKRTGRHNDLGSFTLEQAVQWTTEHLEHHVLYINLKRDRLGKAIKER